MTFKTCRKYIIIFSKQLALIGLASVRKSLCEDIGKRNCYHSTTNNGTWPVSSNSKNDHIFGNLKRVSVAFNFRHLISYQDFILIM